MSECFYDGATSERDASGRTNGSDTVSETSLVRLYITALRKIPRKQRLRYADFADGYHK